jgi:hypothetical protein
MRSSYRHITIFICEESFNFPIVSKSSSTMVAACEKGDSIIVIDDDVYVRHKENDQEKTCGAYGKAVIGRDFIELNEKLFREDK